MKKLMLIAALLFVGCKDPNQPKDPPTPTRFEFVESGFFPDGTELAGVKYSVLKDRETDVKYIYFVQKFGSGEDSWGGPCFTKYEGALLQPSTPNAEEPQQ